ncbi:hypothetical protein GUJ93_ZPchr0006g43784 [Zizania palustris]|uniref:Uncharacterized protein n=1 Tax=Zizania palustris TaxID=103762 RepID=A0A8J5T7F8_ZIZPA|nr:hypothetical protein GUJ93_ZPchr0006g43784 [Zizania palustris]
MSCTRAASTLVVVVLVVSLLALHHPVAHARHVKNTSMLGRDSSSSTTKRGPDDVKKLDEEKAKNTIQAAEEVRGWRGKGARRQRSRVSKSGHGGGSSDVESAEVAVVQRRGPTPHPKKHNL